MKKVTPSERMAQERFRGVERSGDSLGEAARQGAQRILPRVLEWALAAIGTRSSRVSMLDGIVRRRGGRRGEWRGGWGAA